MELRQNDLERIQDRLQQGIISLDEANIEIVKCQRVRLIKGRMPACIRKALNQAVKDGILGHMKKDNHKPECYYFKPFKHLADDARVKEHNKAIDSLGSLKVIKSSVFANG